MTHSLGHLLPTKVGVWCSEYQRALNRSCQGPSEPAAGGDKDNVGLVAESKVSKPSPASFCGASSRAHVALRVTTRNDNRKRNYSIAEINRILERKSLIENRNLQANIFCALRTFESRQTVATCKPSYAGWPSPRFCGVALFVGIVGTVSLVLLGGLRTLKQWIEK